MIYFVVTIGIVILLAVGVILGLAVKAPISLADLHSKADLEELLTFTKGLLNSKRLRRV
jgi:hypothetical protein